MRHRYVILKNSNSHHGRRRRLQLTHFIRLGLGLASRTRTNWKKKSMTLDLESDATGFSKSEFRSFFSSNNCSLTLRIKAITARRHSNGFVPSGGNGGTGVGNFSRRDSSLHRNIKML